MREIYRLTKQVGDLASKIGKLETKLENLEHKRVTFVRQKQRLENIQRKQPVIIEKLQDLDKNLKQIKIDKAMINDEKIALINRRTALKNRLNKKSRYKRRVTDHGIVRYLERIMGVNIKDLEETILKDTNAERVEREDGIVVTVKPKLEF